MHAVTQCPCCSYTERGLVAEYNRLLAIPEMRNSPLVRYDYMLCHGCGLVYASMRPDRAEYELLYENFNEFLVRTIKLQRNIFNESGPLSEALRRELDEHYVPWWQLRSAPAEGNRVVRPMLADFESHLGDLPMLLEHVELKDSTVLQLRTKTAEFADFLRRVFGAGRVDVVTLFPIHEYAAQKHAEVRASSSLDYENFSVPFDDSYDLILANHLFIHMLEPAKGFEVVKRHLNAGGTLFFKNELDDVRLFEKGASLFAELRPFHFQQFDQAALARGFGRFGFAVRSMKHKKKSELFGIAIAADRDDRWEPIGAAELSARRAMYEQWREESIASLPAEIGETLYAGEYRELRRRMEAGRGRKRPLRFDDDILPKEPPRVSGTRIPAADQLAPASAPASPSSRFSLAALLHRR